MNNGQNLRLINVNKSKAMKISCQILIHNEQGSFYQSMTNMRGRQQKYKRRIIVKMH